MSEAPADDAEARRRWQLVLGQEAKQRDGTPMAVDWSEGDEQLSAVLDFLFDREYDNRPGNLRDRSGDRGASALSVPGWLAKVRDLFPKSTAESLTRLALERYELTEILADKETLETVEPSVELLRALLAVRSAIPSDLLDAARRLVRKVADELRDKLEINVRRHFTGIRQPRSSSPIKIAKNFDVARTIRKNLQHYRPEEAALFVERTYFFSRVHRQNPWDIILLVDQSGSMVDSLIHSAVLAGIFRALPMLKTRLAVFDTEVVDLSEEVGDPVEVLMQVQLGGGTDIGQAVRYAETLVANPRKTIVVLITDFYEGGSTSDLLAATERLVASGVTMLGLAALDDRADPAYDKDLARRLAKRGMHLAALTPDRLAEWVAKRVRG